MELKKHDIQRITKGKMARFLKDHVLPEFSDEWAIHQGELLYRRRDVLIQAVMVNRSRHLPRFQITYAINIIALAGVPESANLGSPLLAEPRGFIRKRAGILWLEWGDDLVSLANTVLTELNHQAKPSLTAPLNLEEAAAYVEKHRLSQHFYPYLSLGVMKGLLQQWHESAKHLDITEKILAKHLKIFEKNREPAPEWIYEHLRSIREYRSRLGNAVEFWAYCEEISLQKLRKWGMA